MPLQEKSKMAQKASQQHPAKQQGKQQAAGQQPVARSPALGAQAAMAPAQVQGVIHRGKWSQRSQQ
jgi:hypothetical protein